MIKVGPRPERPEFFDSKRFASFVEELWSFQQAGGTGGTQRHFAWREYIDPFVSEARSVLLEYFQGKCAYTEAPFVEGERSHLVLHRPASDALGLEGKRSPEHYWWLIPVWSNWYLASGLAARVKESRFPVQGERAAVPVERADEYKIDERGLLLDPCVDDPVWFLQFWRTGVVGACDIERGKAWPSRRLPATLPHPGVQTILTLDLNNEILVEARRRAARQAMKRVKSALGELEPEAGVWDEWLSPAQPYAAAARQSAALTLLHWLSVDMAPKLAEQPTPGSVRALAERLWAEIAVALICPQGKRWRIVPFAAELLAGEIAERVNKVMGPSVAGRLRAALGADHVDLVTSALEEAEEIAPAEPVEPSPEPEDEAARWQGPVIDPSAHIKAVRIENFKAIREVEIDLLDLEDDEMSVDLEKAWGTDEQDITGARRWWAFLGENGSGKSSVLQAIGLALAGNSLERVMKDAGLDWGDLHRRPPAGSDEDVPEGRIRLDFTNGVRIDLRFDRQRHWWVPDLRDLNEETPVPPPEAAIPDIQTYIRGYGATRLLDSAGKGAFDDDDALPDNVSIENLFDPRACVIDAEAWLLGLSEPDFNRAAPTIAGLLEDHRAAREIRADARPAAPADAPPSWLLTRTDKEVLVEGLPLACVSDGYRAIVAMLCDMMAGLGQGLSSMQSATGIVLIDEIGAHLHPRWRMSITRKLRRALPQVQFIVSTHEPLCLRGLVAKEVVRVLKDPDHGVVVEVVDRSPSTYRVDQLLTSEFFGLETTIDPDIERRFLHYYQLLAIPEAERGEEQEQKFRELREYLYKHAKPSFGFTRRDQLVCDEIDLLFSQEYKKKPEGQTHEAFLADRKARRKKTIQKIQDIWHLRAAAHGMDDGP